VTITVTVPSEGKLVLDTEFKVGDFVNDPEPSDETGVPVAERLIEYPYAERVERALAIAGWMLMVLQ
jgi:hypothetical protein